VRKAARLAASSLAAIALLAPTRQIGACETVTEAAIWNPDTDFLGRFHAQCDTRGGDAFDACFAAAMAKAGAPKAALEFTRRLDNQAYLQALVATGGPVEIAHVVYPFRANENNAWLLVNGRPPLIDVDDRRLLSLPRMRSSPAYAQIRRTYPNVAFWPGNRSAAGPEILQNGRKFVVEYLLRDQCHACATVGRVRYAFDFDAHGKFNGTRLVSVIPADR
jgi:hypothetical protein